MQCEHLCFVQPLSFSTFGPCLSLVFANLKIFQILSMLRRCKAPVRSVVLRQLLRGFCPEPSLRQPLSKSPPDTLAYKDLVPLNVLRLLRGCPLCVFWKRKFASTLLMSNQSDRKILPTQLPLRFILPQCEQRPEMPVFLP